jgi:uncharacterized protein YggL (DUF469 family)
MSGEISGEVTIDQKRSTLGSTLKALEGQASQTRLQSEAELSNSPTSKELRAKAGIDRARHAVLDHLFTRHEQLNERQIDIASRIASEVTASNSFSMSGTEQLDFSGNIQPYPTLREVVGVFGFKGFNGKLSEAVDKNEIAVEGGRYDQRFVLGTIEVPLGKPGDALKAEVSFKPIGGDTMDAPHSIYIRPVE